MTTTRTTTTTATVTPHVAEAYEVGAILESSWGYDQTNIDYYVVTKRNDNAKGDTWLTLLPMTTTDKVETLHDQGHCMPGEIVATAKSFRRKLSKYDGREGGVAIHSYGWCSLWDGKPSRWSSYA